MGTVKDAYKRSPFHRAVIAEANTSVKPPMKPYSSGDPTGLIGNNTEERSQFITRNNHG